MPNPPDPLSSPGGGGGGSRSGGGSEGGAREAMMRPTKGTTCEKWRSIAPITRAMVGIARAPQMMRLRLELITRIASPAATRAYKL